MKNNSILRFILLCLLIYGVFYLMMPSKIDSPEASPSTFSTQRALQIVRQISQKPHYVGSKNHATVADFLFKELQRLGAQPAYQEGYTLSEGGTLVYSKNIVAKIKGTTSRKALLLVSHYDSAPHSNSKGASDDAAGIATVLESLRAFLHEKIPPKNDIIVLFSDAEELGLNGAALFVTKHQWAKNIGLALNFEARGSSGPSYMLMETNDGNASMVAAFAAGNTPFPVTNSLLYSIYKMLPNDTDLTVFREQAAVQGFNFAFIDNHFHYHTELDSYANLDPLSLAHQGSYLLPLLQYFSQTDLSTLNSKNDEVYCSVPFGMLHYPFSWIFPLLIVAYGLVFAFVFIGMGKQVLRIDALIKGFLPFFGALLLSGGIAYIGWPLLCAIYPHYTEILQGFPYNGHDYIAAFVSLTLGICMLCYEHSGKKNPEMNQSFAPLFVGLLLNTGIAVFLKGASFFILPVLSSALMVGFYVLTQKSNPLLNLLLSLPTLILVVPLIVMFPIGLGMKILVGSALLTVLTFGWLLPVLGSFPKKSVWALCCFLVSIGCFVKAHQAAAFSKDRPKPNSLVYLQNRDTQQSFWTTYDTTLDEWTRGYLGSNPQAATQLNDLQLYSKYGSAFTYLGKAPHQKLAGPTLEILRDTVQGNQRLLHLRIRPNRPVNRYDLFTTNAKNLNHLTANGVKAIAFDSKIAAPTNGKILTYYVVNNQPLEIRFSIPKEETPELVLLESSFDLLAHPQFRVAPRPSNMIPKPFVLNDAIVIRQKIDLTKPQVSRPTRTPRVKNVALQDSLPTTVDSLRP